jgi:hypothetical protein
MPVARKVWQPILAWKRWVERLSTELVDNSVKEWACLRFKSAGVLNIL